MQEVLTIEEIKAQYPDQWVLVGNPELRNPETNGSFVNRLIKGIVLFTPLLIFTQCTSQKTQEQQFDTFYRDAETKFADCIDWGFKTYNHAVDLEDCDPVLKSDTEKRFDLNGIHSDNRILGATLKATGFGRDTLCGYSKGFVGHYDKPVLDTTIYHVVAKMDTSIVLPKDTLHYSVDIRKTIVYFKCRNKYFEAKMDIKIPEEIDMGTLKTINAYNQERIRSLSSTFKTKYD